MSKWELRARRIDLELTERFTIARGSWDVASNVFVSLTLDGVTGLGEAGPAARWDESCRSVMEQIEAVDLSRLAGPFDLEGVGDLLPAGSARSALDMALHDLAGRRAGCSVAELLGLGGRALPPTSVTVPIAEPARMVERARSLADHPILKTKVGFDGDVDAVAAIREVFDGKLRVDANEGWTPEQAEDRLGRLEAYDIELCEQPVPAGHLEALGRVSRSTSIPVFADEDVCTAGDVARLRGAVDGVNLKLRKCGGIREAMRAAGVARTLGMGLMLGCEIGSGIAATAEASIASLFDHLDIDGPLLLLDDPFPGVRYERGSLLLPPGPGLGIDVESGAGDKGI